MSDYKEIIKQPFSNLRKWITDLNRGASTSSATSSSFAAATATSSASASVFTGAGTSVPFGVAQTPIPQHLEEIPGVAEIESSFPPETSMECLSPTEIAPNPKIGETMNEFESIRQSLDSLKIQSKLSETQMQEFREAFRFFDKDGDGSITKDELGIVMRSLGQFASEEELKEMLKEVDINGDGLFSFEEFVEIVSNYSGNTGGSTDEEQELRDAFRIFDKHNRGYISASDLRAVLHCLGEDLSEDEIEDMIKEVDVDGDGRIDFNEFVRALGEPDLTEEEEDEEVEDAECEYQFTQ
ncbi:unnamed protein product [Orchesella dallaii]|uniref:EF-hand domain-containing protein n=1 Tax=Orchesella dallaii TaxID=48710 RepID=A0ABP1RWV4_9HEXA